MQGLVLNKFQIDDLIATEKSINVLVHKNTKETVVQNSMIPRVEMNKAVFSSICDFVKWKIGTISNGMNKGHEHLLLSTLNYIKKRDIKIEGSNQILTGEFIGC